MSGPRWIKQWISDMAALNEQFRNDDGLVDFDALGREEYSFRVALITKKFAKSERAREIYRVAKIAYDSSVENGKKGGRPKKSQQDAPNGNAGVDMYDAGNGAASKSPTSCDTFTAAAATREGVVNLDGTPTPTKAEARTAACHYTADWDTREDSLARTDWSAITRNETRHLGALEPSANHYATRQAKNGDAATREGADVSTTVSRNMRRVPQNGAPAHGFSGGRTAQGTMSRSPEAAAQSGKASALDGLPDKDVQSAKTRDNSDDSRCRYAPPSCSPEDGNIYDKESSTSEDDHQPEGLTGPSHGGSVASLEAMESQALESQRRTDGSSVRGMAKVAQPPVRPRAKNSRCPNSRVEFHAFVADKNLHEGLAEEWYAMHEAREWVDIDGKPIKDWRGALYNYCTKTEQKRRNA